MRVAKSKHYEFNNEMFSAITHAFALGLAVVGTIALGIKGANSGSQLELISYLGFGISLIILYTASTAFHGFYFSKARHVLQVLQSLRRFHINRWLLPALLFDRDWRTIRDRLANCHLGALLWRHPLQAVLLESLQASGNHDLRHSRLALLNRHGATVASLRTDWLLVTGCWRVSIHRWRYAVPAKRHPLHPCHLAPVCHSR